MGDSSAGGESTQPGHRRVNRNWFSFGRRALRRARGVPPFGRVSGGPSRALAALSPRALFSPPFFSLSSLFSALLRDGAAGSGRVHSSSLLECSLIDGEICSPSPEPAAERAAGRGGEGAEGGPEGAAGGPGSSCGLTPEVVAAAPALALAAPDFPTSASSAFDGESAGVGDAPRARCSAVSSRGDGDAGDDRRLRPGPHPASPQDDSPRVLPRARAPFTCCARAQQRLWRLSRGQGGRGFLLLRVNDRRLSRVGRDGVTGNGVWRDRAGYALPGGHPTHLRDTGRDPPAGAGVWGHRRASRLLRTGVPRGVLTLVIVVRRRAPGTAGFDSGFVANQGCLERVFPASCASGVKRVTPLVLTAMNSFRRGAASTAGILSRLMAVLLLFQALAAASASRRLLRQNWLRASAACSLADSPRGGVSGGLRRVSRPRGRPFAREVVVVSHLPLLVPATASVAASCSAFMAARGLPVAMPFTPEWQGLPMELGELQTSFLRPRINRATRPRLLFQVLLRRGRRGRVTVAFLGVPFAPSFLALLGRVLPDLAPQLEPQAPPGGAVDAAILTHDSAGAVEEVAREGRRELLEVAGADLLGFRGREGGGKGTPLAALVELQQQVGLVHPQVVPGPREERLLRAPLPQRLQDALLLLIDGRGPRGAEGAAGGHHLEVPLVLHVPKLLRAARAALALEHQLAVGAEGDLRAPLDPDAEAATDKKGDVTHRFAPA
ncbi:hypothetical protein C7M84_021732 [Penaeus vannamei]|uniref:Uncharacterized protein n=1 Tax=Penaeus vannamei TaxID=6689 RepID=A0A3R7Q9D1_PENVA|nr:hypothetical protein C7M84_021732 [Penaeus vannamei]